MSTRERVAMVVDIAAMLRPSGPPWQGRVLKFLVKYLPEVAALFLVPFPRTVQLDAREVPDRRWLTWLSVWREALDGWTHGMTEYVWSY